MYTVGEWTIVKDRREDDLWLVYPTEEGSNSLNSKYFASEVEAVEFAENYSTETEENTMKNYEVRGTILNTVEDVVKELLTCPKDYTLTPLGQQCTLAIDHYNQCVYMDDPSWIDEFEEELREQMAGYDVPDGNRETISLYVLMGYEDICQNGNYEAQLYGVYSTEELAREAGDELVKAGNISYYEIECPKVDEFGWR